MIDFKNGSIFKLKKVENSFAKDVEPLLVQGVTGKKKDFSSLPYSKLQAFSVETAGTLDLDSELELYYSGLGRVKFDFTGSSDIISIGQAIGSYIL